MKTCSLMTIVSIILLCFCIVTSSSAQHEGNVWMLGYEPYDTALPERAADTTRGSTDFNFNYDPVRIYRDSTRKLDMAGGNATLCDKEGQVIAYSNGQVIYGPGDEPIVDTINYDYGLADWYCRDWEYNNVQSDLPFNFPYAIPTGLLGFQRTLLLPILDKIYCIYTTLDYCTSKFYRIAYSKFVYKNFSYNVLEKDHLVNTDSILLGGIFAVRHGNGNDWWLINGSLQDDDKLCIYLVSKDGIQKEGCISISIDRLAGVSALSVSSDGKYVVINRSETLELNHLFLFSFDRCSGELTKIFDQRMGKMSQLGDGVEFSYDSKKLYVADVYNIWQYDLTSSNIGASVRNVAKFDGTFYHFPGVDIEYSSYLSYLKLAPDGRIYTFPPTAVNRYIGQIDFPDEKGMACIVKQHSIYTPTIYTRTTPNIPNYRLGPLDGSSCDTLGLDNHPIAKYRYEPDSIDYKRIRFTDLSYFRPEIWSWDFGDGSPKISQRSPYHTYAQNGTYKVCLTVSNENSSNTFCRDITIGPSAVDDDQAEHPADITLFPNPVQDILLVTIGEYIPERGYIEIYNIAGQQVHKQRAYYGHNNVDMSGLPAGTYVLRVMDGSCLVKEEKVVKVD